MSNQITSLTLRGFKSIREIDRLEFKKLNILIGANGAGKSNLLGFFRLVRSILRGNLQLSVARMGGASRLLFHGPKRTQSIQSEIASAQDRYQFEVRWTSDETFVFASEGADRTKPDGTGLVSRTEEGHRETAFRRRSPRDDQTPQRLNRWSVLDIIAGLDSYHFQDSGETSPMRLRGPSRLKFELAPDGSNIAAFLSCMQLLHESAYSRIRDSIRLVAPFVDDFIFEPIENGTDPDLLLEWRQAGSDFYKMHPSQLSDGTLRFICLAAALLQPQPPTAIILDEPELGLHPYAITVLASLLKQASQKSQVIISTQSPTLLEHFDPAEVIVVDHDGQESKFRRLDAADLKDWLEDYSLGQLWRKNVFGGGPHS